MPNMEHLAARLGLLRSSQNADGGWGFFPSRQSWLEPTVYAALALTPDPASSDRVRNAWKLVRSWQNADGGWRPTQAVAVSTWCTALAVTLADVLGEGGPQVERGAEWLIRSAGTESGTLPRVLRFLGIGGVEREVKYAGWPWRPDTSAWVEPTAHALVALKRLARRQADRRLLERIDTGERMLLSVRCTDGGWNYGSPRALGVELPSYAETTGLALVGLQDRAPADAVRHAHQLMVGDISPLAHAWLRLAVDPAPIRTGIEGDDLLLCALQALDRDLFLSGRRA